MNIKLVNSKKLKWKLSSSLWASSIALLIQIQPLCTMDEGENPKDHIDQLCKLETMKPLEKLEILSGLYRGNFEKLLDSITSAKVSTEIQRAIAKKLFQDMCIHSDKGEIDFDKLNKTANKIIKVQEEKQKELEKEEKQKELGFNKLLQKIKDEILILQDNKKETHIEKLKTLQDSEPFKKIDKTLSDAYKNLLYTINIAQVSPEIQQALAKRLLQKMLQQLNNNNIDFEALRRDIKKLIDREEEKYKSERLDENTQVEALNAIAEWNKKQLKETQNLFAINDIDTRNAAINYTFEKLFGEKKLSQKEKDKKIALLRDLVEDNF